MQQIPSRIVTGLKALQVFALIFAVVVAGAVAQARPAEQTGQAAPIRLRTATFTPTLGERPAIPPGLSVAGYNANQRGYYLVQFAGPIRQDWKDQVAAAGGEFLGYVPDFAFKVRMNPAEASRVEALENVAWVGIFQPAYKLSPNLKLEGTNLFRIRVERGANYGLTNAALAATGAEILNRSDDILLVAADAPQVQAIANVLDIAWVENFALREKHNESGAGVILGANLANANGYDGSTQTAAVADTGLGDGTKAGAHPDIPPGRIVSIYNWPGVSNQCIQTIVDDGAIDVDSGHGTHVSVSVLGDGGPSGEGKGAASGASLVFQATENWAFISQFCQLFGGWPPEGYFLTGLPDDLNDLFQQAYDDGARIHANSWGSSLAGEYTLDSANSDEFVWNHSDLVITFSAGNEGVDNNNDGVVDNDSIGSPATAKNVITVGASENVRADSWPCDTGLGYDSHDAYQPNTTCSEMGGLNLLGTWGQRYGFTTNPLKDDVTAGNQEQMASWSSRGPVDDGRIKPDIVAPGTWILSGYSDLYQEGYDGDPVDPLSGLYQWDGWGMPLNKNYKYMGGTSMSNPIAAGAATVVRDFYQKAHAHSASAALTKATLINSAIDMLDENNDGVDDNDFPIPNIHEGWGRIDLVGATDGNRQFVDSAAGVSTGGTDTHQFNIGSAGSSFKVSLVWSDYPSTEAAAANLVNNLDLVVTAPGGAVQYRGNVFSSGSGWSQIGGSADSVNNVENVYIQSAAAGTWTVEIVGANVPTGPQPFALVVDGNFGLPSSPTPTPTSTSTPESTNTPTPTSTPTPESTNTPTPTSTPTNTPAADSVHIADLDGTAVSSGKDWRAQVTITVRDESDGPVVGADVAFSWSGGATGTGSCQTAAGGVCTVESQNMAKKTANAVLTVDDVTYGSSSYEAAANSDPDGDSSGTAIQVNKDGTTQSPGGTSPTPTSTPTPVPGNINLSATGYKVKGVQHVDLVWSGADTVDIYRDNLNISTDVSTDEMPFTDNIGAKGGGSYDYQVCEAGSSTTCSDIVTVVF